MNDNIRLGVLTGISYVTGLDYYKSINEHFMQNRKPVYALNPNPNLVFASVDCDKYVHLLEKHQFDKVSNHLMEGVKKLVDSEQVDDELTFSEPANHGEFYSVCWYHFRQLGQERR
mgnify:CR=1 FL=1